jgi:hypothetical protein
VPLASPACQTKQRPTFKRQSNNWHTNTPTVNKKLYPIQVNHIKTMRFNPFSDRDQQQRIDETDEIGFTILFAMILIIGGLFANKVMTKESELNYLQQNNCKVQEYDVKTSNQSKMTLWVCDNSKHFVTQ